MRTEEWIKVEELLNAALELEPVERRKLLDEIGESAPDLRREVESLLACEEKVDDFLAAPALAFSADFFDDDTPDTRAGQEIGHYRIIREIGRGGQGAVFLAERADGEFKQEVALKVVRRSFADSDLARRFRQERQILASLNHPNIARLLDGGVSASDEPFLVMEYVEGARIDDYCAGCDLSTSQRLRLFQEVCRGVSYAHQHLVVHRDIKPSNILITTDGVPKLLDFGIAKLLDPEQAGEHTQTEMRAFTPDYASPEQISGGQITTASDVYSLGVLLHDLLNGGRSSTAARKAPGGWLSETPGQKTIATNLSTDQADEDKGAKTTLRKFASAELENIIAMARREDPARRYSSAAQLAEDVQRYLDGLPVRAQKDSFTYRAGKFVRRNKVGVSAAAIILLTLVGGIIATVWQARRATRQARIAAEQRDRAERRFSDVRQLSNALLSEIAPKIERLQGSIEARQSLVNQSLKYLDSLALESSGDLQLQGELASAYEKVGELQGGLGKPNLSDFSGALSSLEKARTIRQHLLQRNPQDAENQKRLAANLSASSYIRWWTSDVSGSIKESEQALELYSKLIAAEPRSTELRVAAADARINLAQTYYFNDQVAETYPPLRSALSELETLRESDAHNTEIGRLLGKGYALLGVNMFWDNKQAEGEAEINKALTLSETLVAQNPNDNVVRQGLWHVYTQSSQFYQDSNAARALEILAKALKLAEEAVKSDPVNTQARQNLAKTYSMLGLITNRLKKLDESAAYLEKSLAVFSELEQAEPRNLTYKDDIGRNLMNLGQTQYQQHDYTRALTTYEQAVAVFEYQASDPKNLFPLRRLATVHAYIADAHRDLAKAARGEENRKHQQIAKENYQRALDLLLQLQAQNALAEYDRKVLEEMRAAVRK
jgi:non-specific serine/threonine protein kinase/serine/threonine-protein kinase